MFDLEQSIAQWRKQMLAGGIKSPVPLEELEAHLRDEVERQAKSGLGEEAAFKVSTQQIGQPTNLKNEFKKVESTSMKRRLMILVGVCILLFGTVMILPALGKHKQRNQAALASGTGYFSTQWAHDEVYGLTLGTTVFAAGCIATIYGLKKRKA